MIKLSYPGGSEVLVNPNQIFTVEQTPKGTRIVTAAGAAIVVAEDIDRVQIALGRSSHHETEG